MVQQLIVACSMILLCHINLLAQVNTSSKDLSGKGTVTIHQSPEVDAAIERFKKYNYSAEGVEGYRIQIFSESGNEAKAKAEKVLTDYKSLYDFPVGYLTYQQPNFKVRCGDFRTKSEARKYVKLISATYPSAFIVKDAINVKE
jgi:hypothetical protein